jgi:hypothetical protein
MLDFQIYRRSESHRELLLAGDVNGFVKGPGSLLGNTVGGIE